MVFYIVLQKLLPLYAIVAAGFLLGQRMEISRETVARLLIYLISPLVVFHATWSAKLSAGLLALPLVFFALCCTICLGAFFIARRIWPDDATANLAAFAAGDANTGYFGLPVALAIFGDWALAPMVLGSFGFILYENTLGFFVTARGHHTPIESLRKVLRLPIVYAFALGIFLNFVRTPCPVAVEEVFRGVRGAYSLLGMLLIGLSASSLHTWRTDGRFLTFCFASKFLVWPAAAFLLVLVDAATFQFFTGPIRQVVFLLATVPMAANVVAIATELRVQPEKAAVAVLASTAFALVYLPWVGGWLYGF